MKTIDQPLLTSSRMYDWVARCAHHPYALTILGSISFLESFIFPIPVEVLFIPITLTRIYNCYRIAFITAATSVLGALVGYYIGLAFFDLVGLRLIEIYGCQKSFLHFQTEIQKWGFWLICCKAVVPIPFKIICIGAGMTHLNLASFIAGSIVARSVRYFSVAFILKVFGQKFEDQFRLYFPYFLMSLLAICTSTLFLAKFIKA